MPFFRRFTLYILVNGHFFCSSFVRALRQSFLSVISCYYLSYYFFKLELLLSVRGGAGIIKF